MVHDLKIWFKYEWSKYIPIILLFLYAAVAVNVVVEKNGMTANIADYLVMMFKGLKPYERKDTVKNIIGFHLPVYYLLFNVYISWIISYFPFRDMGNYGKLLMIKQGNKQKWWLNKCIWSICAVFSSYLTGYIVFFLAGLFKKSVSLEINVETLKLITDKIIDETNVWELSEKKLIVLCVILPVLMSVAISIFQMVLSLVMKPLYGQMLVIGLLVISAYYCNGFLPGNYLMLLRNSIITKNGGVNFYYGIVISIMMILSGIGLGLKIIKKKDII